MLWEMEARGSAERMTSSQHRYISKVAVLGAEKNSIFLCCLQCFNTEGRVPDIPAFLIFLKVIKQENLFQYF